MAPMADSQSTVACRLLAGGRCLVVMEYLGVKEGWIDFDDATLHPEVGSLYGAMTAALSKAHACEPRHAHGDLRDANLRVRWYAPQLAHAHGCLCAVLLHMEQCTSQAD